MRKSTVRLDDVVIFPIPKEPKTTGSNFFKVRFLNVDTASGVSKLAFGAKEIFRVHRYVYGSVFKQTANNPSTPVVSISPKASSPIF